MKKIFIILMLFVSCLLAQNSYSTSSNWLEEVPSEVEKFKAIEKQFRGFDLAMVEVGYRFNAFYFAIKDKNYDLASYQWDKIKKSMVNGIIRRPARAKNTKNMFIDTQYKAMKKALIAKNDKLIAKEYETSKIVCNACHHAEKVPFIEVIDPQYRWLPVK